MGAQLSLAAACDWLPPGLWCYNGCASHGTSRRKQIADTIGAFVILLSHFYSNLGLYYIIYYSTSTVERSGKLKCNYIIK